MANDIGGCNAVLVTNIEFDQVDLNIQLYILDVVDESTYNQVKKGIDTGFKIPVKGVDIDFDGSYDEFKDKREKIFKKYEFERNEKRSEEKLRKYLPDKAIEAWYKCKQLFADQQMYGIKAWVGLMNDHRCLVNIGWYPPPEAAKTGIVTNSSLSGGSVTGAPPGKVFNNRERFKISEIKTVPIDRANKQTIVLSVDVNGTNCSLTIPYKSNPESKVGEAKGQKTVEIPFKNDRESEIDATIKVTFILPRLSPDSQPSSIEYCTLSVQQNEAKKEIASTRQIVWNEEIKLADLEGYYTIAAGQKVLFVATIGPWDRFNYPESKVQWKIEY